MIECGRLAIDSRSEGNATMEFRNLGAAEKKEKTPVLRVDGPYTIYCPGGFVRKCDEAETRYDRLDVTHDGMKVE